MSQTYSISELAREFDITTRTIRFYEDKQLLKPERIGTTRIYSRADRTRLRLVLRGKRLGWQLSEIHKIIELYDSRNGKGEKRQLEVFIKRLEETRAALLSQQDDLDQSLSDIASLQANCLRQLANLSDCQDGSQEGQQVANPPGRTPTNRGTRKEPCHKKPGS